MVFTDTGTDPVALGLVDSLARPGGNVTGFYSMADVLAGKRLEVLKESMPKLSRVAVLRNAQAAENDPQWKESQNVARQLGLQTLLHGRNQTRSIQRAFKDAIKSGIPLSRVTVLALPIIKNQSSTLALKNRLPAMHYREDFVEQGGLMSYGADEVEPFKRVAAMVDKILKGTKPPDIRRAIDQI